MNGFIKIHRTVLDHWLGDNPSYAGAWMLLLLEAQWRDGTKMVKGAPTFVKRGDLICSHRYLASRWDWSVGKVQRFLRLLTKYEMIETTRLESGSQTITICNYEKYQSHESVADSGAIHSRFDAESKKKESKEGKEESHTMRAMPVYGLQSDIFEMKDGHLTIPDVKELARWEGIFGNYLNLSIALAGFTPNKAYSGGDSLNSHARHYLSNKAQNVNRQPAKRPSLADKFR